MWFVAAALAGEIEDGVGIENVVGYSADGLWFVVEAVQETPTAQYHLAVAIGDDGARQVWALSQAEPTPDVMGQEWPHEAALSQAPGQVEYEAWSKEQGVAPARSGDRCDGVELYVDSIATSAWSASPATVEWKGDAFVGDPSGSSVPYLVYGVARGDERWELGRANAGYRMGSWFSALPNHVFWNASCARVAVVSIDPDPDSGRSDNYTSYGNRMMSASFHHAGPRVGVVGGSAEAVRSALESAGFGASISFETPPKHDGTVVYAWSKATPYAKKVAATIPGARVEVMSWQTSFDVVVAVP